MLSTSPLISVVIPAYNCEKTIQATLNSVCQQTYTALEIIVINDGSTDDTLGILNAFQDSRLKVLTYDNSGASISRNRGISAANGDFIAFVDADDIWLPDKLAEQLAALQQASQSAVAYSWTNYIDEAGKFLRSGYHCRYSGNVYQRLLKGSFLESGSNPLIRRIALKTVGGFDESLKTCEDWELWIRLASHYEFAMVPQVHVNYRITTSSKSFKLDKHEAGGLVVIDKAFNDAPASLQEFKAISKSNFYKYLLFKVLDAPHGFEALGRWRSLTALRYLLLSIYQKPDFLRQPKVILSALTKILIILIWPAKRPQDVLASLKQRQDNKAYL